MKTLLYLVLMTLICHLLHVSAGPVALQLLKGDCCPRVSQHGIPKKCVKNMSMTPDHCKLKAVKHTDKKNFFLFFSLCQISAASTVLLFH
uniref:Chemokine interleukin-8-like domain-containing protein n=1 Tax=Scophthalmus maximus TaxID=52904 RepID=A0A8D2ZST9_SCOMX